jgi:hypothetical protein
MMTTKALLAAILLAALSAGSCIFQNDPLEPNRPPEILSYTPDVSFFTLTAPDSCAFSMLASDPDGDEIRYSWLVGDSVISSRDTAVFHAVRPGAYAIRGVARDGARRAIRDWQVTVLFKDDAPPRIEWYFPEQKTVACAVGDTIEFHIRATDDHPESLRYIYRLDGEMLHSGSPHLVNRFMERGDFVLDGIAWDGQHGDTISWNVNVTGFPDTIAPGAIVDLAGYPGDLDGTIRLEWTAPGDDGYEGRAASYIVRTSIYPIVTENDWRNAEGKVGEPVPSVAGTREQMTIRNLVSASYVFVTMRAVDDFFNLSPLGNCVKAAVRGIDIGGRVRDARTGEGIPGVFVASGIRSDTSAADGSYFLRNVASYATHVSARDELVSGQLGAYYDIVMPIQKITQFISLDFDMIGVFGLVNTVEPDQYLGRFLAFYKGILQVAGDYGQSTVYRGWNHWPLTVYNPPFVWQGIDLKAAASGAMGDWESLSGLDFFVEVESQEGADVVIRYDTINDYRHSVATPEYNGDGTPKLREVRIFTKNSEVPLSRFARLVFAHELGHVIGVYHSRNVGHLMVGLTMPQIDHPTTDEINVVKCLYRIKNIFDYSWMLEE